MTAAEQFPSRAVAVLVLPGETQTLGLIGPTYPANLPASRRSPVQSDGGTS